MRSCAHAVAAPLPSSLLLFLFVVSSSAIHSLASSTPHNPPDEQDPFNIMRAVHDHAVAERNAERAVSAADTRAREAEKRAEAADIAAGASRDLALHFQIESNTRLARVHVLDEEVERLQRLLGAANADKDALMVRVIRSIALLCHRRVCAHPQLQGARDALDRSLAGECGACIAA